MESIGEYFCDEEDYYYNTWINGNKNHVIAHLRVYGCSTYINYYNRIIDQFTHDESSLNSLLKKVRKQTGSPINKQYL